MTPRNQKLFLNVFSWLLIIGVAVSLCLIYVKQRLSDQRFREMEQEQIKKEITEDRALLLKYQEALKTADLAVQLGHHAVEVETLNANPEQLQQAQLGLKLAENLRDMCQSSVVRSESDLDRDVARLTSDN
jgi:hypothetical protein